MSKDSPALVAVQGPQGRQVLDAIERGLKREIVMGEAERTASVLWLPHTYIFETFNLTPRLFVTSVDPGAGKSRLLRLLETVSHHGLRLGKATEAFLGRAKVQGKPSPTIILDQLDNALDEDAGRLIDRLCGGAENGIKQGLVEKIATPKGEKQGPALFDFFYPVALGKIGGLPNRALNDRCITIRMHPATEAEDEWLWKHATGKIEPELAEQLAAWTGSLPDLSGTRPDMPRGIARRMRDKWHPLFAIADAAGGDWPERARQAAVELEDKGDEPEPGHITVLRQLVALVDKWPFPVIFRYELERKGFRDSTGGGAQLPKVGLTSRNQRRGKEIGPGYKIADIRAAEARYLVQGVQGVPGACAECAA